MADFPNILQRDYSLKPHSKLSPMNSPRSGGAGFFSTIIGASRVGPIAKSRSFADGTVESASNFVGDGVSEGSLPFLEKGGVSSYRASPLGRAVEEPFTAPAVDYDDVFGGPPRYATAMFSSQSGALPAMDEIFRSPARVPSFRSSSLPVFELPVFGDEVFGVGGIAYGPRPAAVAYEDIFSEAGTGSPYPVANLSGSSLTGVSRSRPSSRSSSRRISPVHSAASVDNPAQDSVPTVKSSTERLKARSIAGKFIRRFSSSFSSYDESGGKPMDSPFAALKTDLVASSVPSSPPCAGPWDHLKRPVRSNSGSSIRSLGSGFDVEVDDVFGGFPQRRSLLSHNTFSGVQCEADVNNTRSLKTYGAEGIGKQFAAASGSECRVSPAAVDKLDGSGSIDPTIPSSPSSTDEQELNGDFIEIRMDRQNDSVVSEKIEGKAWVTVNDVSLSTWPTCKSPPARPPPAPATQLKFKTWKDWASEFPVSHSASFSPSVSVGSTFNSFPELSTAAASAVTAEREESADGEGLSGCVEDWVHTVSNSVPEQSEVPAAGKKMKAKSAKEAVEAEERELQAMLVNAWKLNEKREMEKQVPEPAQETREALEEIGTELHWKEWRKRLNRQFKASQPKPEMQVGSEVTETDTNLKEWKKYPGREKTEGVTKDKVTTEEPAKNITTTIDVVPVQVQDKLSNMAVRICPSGLEESVYREEMVKIVTDDMCTNSSAVATEPSPSGRNGTEMKKIFPEDVASAQERSDLTAEEQSMRVSSNPGMFTSDQTSVNGGGTELKFTDQTFVQDGKEREELLQSEETEDLEFSAGDISFSNGFEKIEGESLERTRSRWQRHVRARERVAKALEDKKQRDAEVQREQAEKQQLAEASDHQIKRWATGKEGNLRALLSNLQHVLWSDSGWQPIPLTDLIEGAAVKKAYRKATLFVHPDKVQQKGATVQQKYVAERVFDILKEAWKTYGNQDLF